MKFGEGMFKRGVALTLALLMLGQAGATSGAYVYAEDSAAQVITVPPIEENEQDAVVTPEDSESETPAGEAPEGEVLPEETDEETPEPEKNVTENPESTQTPDSAESEVTPEVVEKPEEDVNGEVPGVVEPVSDTQVFWNPNDEPTYNTEGIIIVYAGSDDNDGQSTKAPVLSLDKALQLAGSTKTIVCMNVYAVPQDTTLSNTTIIGYDGNGNTEAAHAGALFSVAAGNLTLTNAHLQQDGTAIQLDGGNVILNEGVYLEKEIMLGKPLDTEFPIQYNAPNLANGGKYTVNFNSNHVGIVGIAEGDHLNDFALSENLIAQNWEIFVKNGNTYARVKPRYDAIYLDGVKGDDSELGNAPDCPVKTFERAKQLMAQYAKDGVDTIYVMDTVTVSDNETYELASTGARYPAVKRYEKNNNTLFQIIGGNPTFQFAIRADKESILVQKGTLTMSGDATVYGTGSPNIQVAQDGHLKLDGEKVGIDEIGVYGQLTMTAGRTRGIGMYGSSQGTFTGGFISELVSNGWKDGVSTIKGTTEVKNLYVYEGTVFVDSGTVKYVDVHSDGYFQTNGQAYIEHVTLTGSVYERKTPCIHLSGEPKQEKLIEVELHLPEKKDLPVVKHVDAFNAAEQIDHFILLAREKRYVLTPQNKDIVLGISGVFVDTDKGDDNNTGLREDLPVKTLARAAAVMDQNVDTGMQHIIYVMNTDNGGARVYGNDSLIITKANNVVVLPYTLERQTSLFQIQDGTSLIAKNVQLNGVFDGKTRDVDTVLMVSGGYVKLDHCKLVAAKNGLDISGGSTVDVSDSVITKGSDDLSSGSTISWASQCRGVEVAGATVNLNNTEIYRMSSGWGGAGIQAGAGSVVNMDGCRIHHNGTSRVEANGGGIYASRDATLTLRNTVITDNYAEHHGGGLYWECGANITIDENVTFERNRATYGGGIYIQGGTNEHEHLLNNTCRVIRNKAKYGGGVYVDCVGTIEMMGCDLSGNECLKRRYDDVKDGEARGNGAALYVNRGTVNFRNVNTSDCISQRREGDVFIGEEAVFNHLEGPIAGTVCSYGKYNLALNGANVGVTKEVYLENAENPITLMGQYASLPNKIVVRPTTGFLGQIVVNGTDGCKADFSNFDVKDIVVNESDFDIVAEGSNYVFWDPQNKGGKTTDSNDGSCPAKAVLTWGRVREILADKTPGTYVVLCSPMSANRQLGAENGKLLTVLDGKIGAGEGAWNTEIIRGAPFKGKPLVGYMFNFEQNLTIKNITISGQYLGRDDVITTTEESDGVIKLLNSQLVMENVTIHDYLATQWGADTSEMPEEAITADHIKDTNITYVNNYGPLVYCQDFQANGDFVSQNRGGEKCRALFDISGSLENCKFQSNTVVHSSGYDSGHLLYTKNLTINNCMLGAENPSVIPQNEQECLQNAGNVCKSNLLYAPYGEVTIENTSVYGNWVDGAIVNISAGRLKNVPIQKNHTDSVALYIQDGSCNGVHVIDNTASIGIRSSDTRIQNSTISNNSRDGVHLYSGTLENCNITGNHGVGVTNYGGSLKGTTISDNALTGLVIYNGLGVRLQQVIIENNAQKATSKYERCGMRITSGSNEITFVGSNEIRNNAGDGISIDATGDYCRIRPAKNTDKLLVHHNASDGIHQYDKDNTRASCRNLVLKNIYAYENPGTGIYLESNRNGDTFHVEIQKSEMRANRTGGLYSRQYYGGELNISDTVIADNTSADSGAGIRLGYPEAKLSNVTITGNVADGYGGGINTSGGSLEIDSAVIRGNQSKKDNNKSSGIYVDHYCDTRLNGGQVDIDDTIYLSSYAKPLTLIGTMAPGDNYTIALNQSSFKLGNVVVQPNPAGFPSDAAQYVRFTTPYDEGFVFAKGKAPGGSKVDSIVLKRCIFVDGVNGSDTDNNGKNPNEAYKTMQKALTEAANGNAVIFVSGPVIGSGKWRCASPVEIKRYTGFAIGGVHAYPPYTGDMISVPAGQTLTLGENITGVYGRHTEEDPLQAAGTIFNVNGTLNVTNNLVMGGNGNTTTAGGAIRVGENGNVNITAPLNISDTIAKDGGAIYNKGTVTIANTGSLSMSKMTASEKGSAVYQGGTFTVNEGATLSTNGVIYLDIDKYLTLANEKVNFSPKTLKLDIASPSDGRIYAKYLDKTNVDSEVEKARYKLLGNLTSIYWLDHNKNAQDIDLILRIPNVVYVDPTYTGGQQEGIGLQGSTADYPVTTLEAAYKYLQKTGGLMYIVTPVRINTDVTLSLDQCQVGNTVTKLDQGNVYIRRYSKPEGDINHFTKANTNDQALFEIEKNGSLTLDGVTVDGHATAVTGASEKYFYINAPAVNAKYPLVMVEDQGKTTLTLRNGASLKNNHNITVEKPHEGDAVNNDQNFVIENQAGVEGTVKLMKDDFITIHNGSTSPVPAMHVLLDDPYNGRVIAQYDVAPAPGEVNKYILPQSILDVYKVVIEGNDVLLRLKNAAYVNGVSGDDKMDGTTPETAVKTIKQAYQNLQKDGGGTIYIVDTVTVNEQMTLLGSQYIDIQNNIKVDGSVRILRYSKPTATTTPDGFNVDSCTGIMLDVTENGKVTLGDIIVDGHGNAVQTESETTTAGAVDANEPMFTVSGNLILADGVVLQNNHNVAGDGGAVSVRGTGNVTVYEAEIAGNKANHGNAIALLDSTSRMTTTGHPAFESDQYVYLGGAENEGGSQIHVTNQLDAQTVIPVELPDYYFVNNHKIAEYDNYASDGIVPNKAHFKLRDEKHLMEAKRLGVLTEDAFVLLRAAYSITYQLTDLIQSQDSPNTTPHMQGFEAKLGPDKASVTLPATITVTVQPVGAMEEVTLQEGTDYTYDATTGKVVVFDDSVTGDVTIIAAGVKTFNATYHVELTAKESRDEASNSTVALNLVNESVSLDQLQDKTFHLESCKTLEGVTFDSVTNVQSNKYSAGSDYANNTFAVTAATKDGSEISMDQNRSSVTFGQNEGVLTMHLYNANAITDASDLNGTQIVLCSDVGDRITIELTIKRVASQINISVPLVMVMRTNIDGGEAKVADDRYNIKNLSSMNVNLDSATVEDMTDNMTLVGAEKLNDGTNSYAVTMNDIPHKILYNGNYNPIASVATSRLNFVTKTDAADGTKYGVHMATVNYSVSIPRA